GIPQHALSTPTRHTGRGHWRSAMSPTAPTTTTLTPTAASPAITASGLRKSFGEKVVLDGVDLNVPEGTVFCLLGPNGAGKTTAVHILSTLMRADGGEVRVVGRD